jgi:hypothetical protein
MSLHANKIFVQADCGHVPPSETNFQWLSFIVDDRTSSSQVHVRSRHTTPEVTLVSWSVFLHGAFFKHGQVTRTWTYKLHRLQNGFRFMHQYPEHIPQAADLAEKHR